MFISEIFFYGWLFILTASSESQHVIIFKDGHISLKHLSSIREFSNMSIIPEKKKL